MLARWVLVILVVGCASVPRNDGSTIRDEAYALNREGMIAMSEARFEDAIDLFERASALVTDYGIQGKPLLYTPIFMAGWASEKIGRIPQACASYRRFLTIAPADLVERTKADHAAGHLAAHC